MFIFSKRGGVMRAWHKEAEKQWDERAEWWHQSSEDMWERGSRKTIIPFVTTYMPKEGYIADIGCGDGYGSYKLCQQGYRVIGLDLSSEMIELAKKQRYHEHLHFQQADIMNLPFPDETFSGAMIINCLEWTERPLAALEEVRRVLKTNAYVCVGILGPTAAPRVNSYRRLYDEAVICNTMMPWEFEQLAKENGFITVSQEGVYKRGVDEHSIQQLPTELKQAVSFMWLFMLQKK
ncbi:class I SAM-dependent methyltransferase [Anoxybacillus sp. ST70]|nr:class I SAM-dependent methyltransferase [Anoxybacillus sp. ST70]